jgi:hypothetical protein
MSTHSIASTRPADIGLLRFALTADAAITGANALAYLAGAVVLDSVLGVPAGVLVAIGAFLAVYAALVLRVAQRPTRRAATAVIDANILWSVASIVLLALDTFTPSTVGQVWIALQALVVAGFAALQYAGLRSAEITR